MHTHTAEQLFVLQSKVAEGVEKFSHCVHREIMRRKSKSGEDRMVDSDDKSLAISCSSPCLSTAVIASGCWKIIAFFLCILLTLSLISFYQSSSVLYILFSLLLHPLIYHCLVAFLTGPVDLCQAFCIPSLCLWLHDGNLIDNWCVGSKQEHSLNSNMCLYCRASIDIVWM